ncbi:NAD(P)H-dependent oxidoreductase [Actinomadura keratinilytica]
MLIGAPMYNFTIPSTLKAWLDQVIIVGRTGGETGTVAGTPITVVASRGGSYAEGTPRESFEFVQNYLEKLAVGMLGAEVDFIVPELTLAPVNPAMSELIPLFEASRAKALEEAARRPAPSPPASPGPQRPSDAASGPSRAPEHPRPPPAEPTVPGRGRSAPRPRSPPRPPTADRPLRQSSHHTNRRPGPRRAAPPLLHRPRPRAKHHADTARHRTTPRHHPHHPHHPRQQAHSRRPTTPGHNENRAPTRTFVLMETRSPWCARGS